MKEELQLKLVEIINHIISGVSAAKDFTLSELPDVVTTFMAFSRAWETFNWLALAVAFGCALYVAIAKGYKSDKKDRYGSTADSAIAAMIVGTAASTLLGVSLIVQTKYLLLVWLAPKVYLIQTIAQMIK